jgi:ABC-type cobalamin/Fe3+-siderophores transport system ATPase subunit
MRVKSIRIQNYKSFEDASLTFLPGFNVVVGQNNSGKTALLEALDTPRFENKPHKHMVQGRPAALNPHSELTVDIVVSGKEVESIFLSSGGTAHIPVFSGSGDSDAAAEINSYFQKPEIDFSFRCKPNRQGWEFVADMTATRCAVISTNEDRKGWSVAGFQMSTFSFAPIINQFHQTVFFSRAERLALGDSPQSNDTTLAPRADNLANAMLHLQTQRPTRYKRLNELLHEIFPTIHGVTTKAINNQAKLIVHSIDPKMEYPELGVELSESGTGVGQAVAVLFVIVSADFPRTIVIDEPNSFLHPSAARALFQILKRADLRHQYIISTHAAEIISISEPSTLHLIKWTDGHSVIEVLNAGQIAEVRRALNEIGVRLSEVFGADQIMWVEGETERLCFPLIAKGAGLEWPSGISIVAILHTGDFENKKKDAELIWKIYERLSSSNALLPPALAFSFDREGRTDQQMGDLRKRSRDVVKFLPRRMYENYLIEPNAIASVIHEFSGETVEVDNVRQWLNEHGGDPRYGASGVNVLSVRWLEIVHAGDILKHLFEEVTKTRLSYDKVVHSFRLTEWLLQNNEQTLRELVDYVIGLLGNSPKPLKSTPS